MKKEKKLVLKLNELPRRTEKLDPEKIQVVFGGCSNFGEFCLKSHDCCNYPHDICESVYFGGVCQTYRGNV